jgi:ABC-2 type transport system ATP-binding protein
MILLEFAGVSKHYGARPALDRVNLTVPARAAGAAGAAVGLLGPNGAGKSTAIRLALGLARPTLGHVRLRGRDPLDPRAREHVGWLPEHPRFPARMTVIDVLRLHGRLAGLAGGALDRAVAAGLDERGLATHADERAGALSKGLAQRLGFAQALLGTPELLLLDEPTSGLDPVGIRDARDWIATARTRVATVLVSSHLLTEIERICDQILVLRDGRVLAAGAIETLCTPGESLEDAYLRLVREPRRPAGGVDRIEASTSSREETTG